MAILAIQWPHYAPFLDPPVTCQPDLRNCHGIDLCQGVAKWQVSTRVWKPMAKDNDQQTTEGSNSLGYSLILALWRLSGTSATATIDLYNLLWDCLPWLPSELLYDCSFEWRATIMFIPPSIFCMRQWIRTSLAQNTSILVLICWTTGAKQQEGKLWEENEAWPWIWIYLKLVETNISSEERTAPRLLPLIYVQSPVAMSRHKSPMVCIQRLRLLCSQVLGVQKLFGDAALFLFGVSFVA